MTDFLAGYVVPPRAGVADYFHQINNASTDQERLQIGEQHGIRVVPE